MKTSRWKKGFTLVELIVVIAILGVVAAITVPNYLKYVSRAKEKTCLSNCAELSRFIGIKVFSDKLELSSLSENSEIRKMIADCKCPSGGSCSMDISSGSPVVVCSKHSSGTPASSVLDLAKTLIPAGGYDSNYIRTAWSQKYGTNTPIYYGEASLVLNLATRTDSRTAVGNKALIYASANWDRSTNLSDRYAKMVYDSASGKWYVYKASVSTEFYDIGKYTLNSGDPEKFLEFVKSSGDWSVADKPVSIGPLKN